MSETINGMLYEQNYQIIINDMPDSIYYYFDYDERSYQINMDFQHFHSFYEIHVLLSPRAWHLVEGTPYSIETNDFVLLRPSLLHKSTYPEGAPSKRLIISFLYPNEYIESHPALKTLLEPFSSRLPIYRFDRQRQQILNQVINEIYGLSRHPLPSDVQMAMIHNRFLEFLYRLWELSSYNIYNPEGFDNAISEKIYQITSYIHEHYSEELSLETLTSRFYISPYYLSHQFHKVTGYTLTRYIQMTRIRNAQYALINSRDKITEISERSGFSSFSQFNRVFRKLCGVSPSEFRKHPIMTNSPHHSFSE